MEKSPYHLLSHLDKVLSSVPGGTLYSVASETGEDGSIRAEVEAFQGRRVLMASPIKGSSRFSVRIENYPQVRGQNKTLGKVVEFSAPSVWIEQWVEQAHGARRNK